MQMHRLRRVAVAASGAADARRKGGRYTVFADKITVFAGET